MRNLFDLVGYKNTAPKLGFYIVCRVKEHVFMDEPYDAGWGAASEAMTDIWVREFRVEHTHAEERVAA